MVEIWQSKTQGRQLVLFLLQVFYALILFSVVDALLFALDLPNLIFNFCLSFNILPSHLRLHNKILVLFQIEPLHLLWLYGFHINIAVVQFNFLFLELRIIPHIVALAFILQLES